MKKYFILILSIALFACTQQKGYEITVNLEGAEGQILLEQRGTQAWIPVDTADVVNGVAVFEGEVEFPGDYYLSVLGQSAKALVFVENSPINVTGKADSIYLADITGSATHDEYNLLNDELTQLGENFRPLATEHQKATSENALDKVKELEEKMDKLREDYMNIQKDFLKEKTSSYVTPFILTQINRQIELNELDALLDGLDTNLDTMEIIINLKKRVENLKTVAVGQLAPDFTQNDPDGNPVKFSDIYSKNELTLLDFWAAWCGPCRGENPNVVAVYNEYKDKGFTVFGVSLDREKEAWFKAIKDDNLTWTHVSDLSYWQNAAAKLYFVDGIPHSVLVDKNGMIIAKDKRENELREAVSEFLESKQ